MLGQVTYLIETQSSPVAELHLLVFSRIRRCSVGGEPIFQQVGSFFGQVSSALPVECVVIKAHVLLESDVAILGVVTWVTRSSKEGFILSLVATVDSSLGFVVVAGSWLVHATLLNHGLLERALPDRLLERWWCVRHVTLGCW